MKKQVNMRLKLKKWKKIDQTKLQLMSNLKKVLMNLIKKVEKDSLRPLKKLIESLMKFTQNYLTVEARNWN